MQVITPLTLRPGCRRVKLQCALNALNANEEQAMELLDIARGPVLTVALGKIGRAHV